MEKLSGNTFFNHLLMTKPWNTTGCTLLIVKSGFCFPCILFDQRFSKPVISSQKISFNCWKSLKHMLENKNSRMIVKFSASGNPHNDEAHQEEIMETYCEKSSRCRDSLCVVTERLRVDWHNRTRHKPACVHIYRQLTDTIADNLKCKQPVFELNLTLRVLFDFKCSNNFHLRILPV